jgi:hypothetical protein
VFWEAFAAISHVYDKWTGVSPSKPIKVTYKMYSVNAVFKYLFRLLRLDFGEETPMVLIEGTYAPKRSFIKIHGPMCENRRGRTIPVSSSYTSSFSRLKVIAFKAHFVYETLFFWRKVGSLWVP